MNVNQGNTRNNKQDDEYCCIKSSLAPLKSRDEKKIK
jgi:hypothetical protein